MSEEKKYFELENLSVGYNKKPLIKDICIKINKGQILTLIGPNGSGKSTILKSITKHLKTLGGVVYIDNNDISKLTNKEMASTVSVVLTERVAPEMMTCFDVVAAGRYPYTNNFGFLTDADKKIVMNSLEKVHATDFSQKDFNKLSDGQKQRIMLARAICQEPQVIVLDEPTSFLDIKHKIELLDILRKMAREKNITVIMSLHEIDLAPKISDIVMCVKGDTITKFGKAYDIFKEDVINDLYDIKTGSYNMLFGSVELTKPQGVAKTFIIGGGGSATNMYRELQKRNIPFMSGILFDNDVDYYVAISLADKIFSQRAFENVSESLYQDALKAASNCDVIITTLTKFGEFNKSCEELIDQLKKQGKTIYSEDEYMALSLK